MHACALGGEKYHEVVDGRNGTRGFFPPRLHSSMHTNPPSRLGNRSTNRSCVSSPYLRDECPGAGRRRGAEGRGRHEGRCQRRQQGQQQEEQARHLSPRRLCYGVGGVPRRVRGLVRCVRYRHQSSAWCSKRGWVQARFQQPVSARPKRVARSDSIAIVKASLDPRGCPIPNHSAAATESVIEPCCCCCRAPDQQSQANPQPTSLTPPPRLPVLCVT